MLCKICACPSIDWARAQILKKYSVRYFRCSNCGFIQTEDPYWLEEVYSNAISCSDVGLVNRNIAFTKISKAVIFSLFDSNTSFMDYGGGYGMFVRMMRDAGFDFYWYDKFCSNLFAHGFEANIESDKQYELVTAFEVFEHLVHPLEHIEQMLQFSNSVLFSTRLVPTNNPKPNEWRYYGLEHGQHISFYTLKTLSTIAERFHLKVYSNKISLHLLTKKKLPNILFNMVSRYKIASLINILLRKRSLLADDYFEVITK